jgi:hypothetical protein
MRWTAYDSRTAARAAVATLLMLGVAWAVTASTDEGGVTGAVRAARVLPLAPACAALGTWLAMARARARGEVHVLEALGRSPWQCSAPAIGGAAVVALLCAACVLAVPAIDVQGFFPAPPHAGAYRYEAGAFVDEAGGVRVGPGGEIALSQGAGAGADTGPGTPRAATTAIPPGGRLAAALALAFAGLGFPLATARARLGPDGSRGGSAGMARMAGAVGATVVASILLFHAAAARRAPALLSAVPALVLLVAAAFRYVGDSWQTTQKSRG